MPTKGKPLEGTRGDEREQNNNNKDGRGEQHPAQGKERLRANRTDTNKSNETSAQTVSSPDEWTEKQVQDALLPAVRENWAKQKINDSLASWSDKSGWDLLKLEKRLEQLRKIYRDRTPSDPAPASTNATGTNSSAFVLKAAAALGKRKDLRRVFCQHLRRIGYWADEKLAGSLLLSHGARLLPTSMGFGLVGQPGSGKSDGLICASKFLPPEQVISITDASERAFYYLGDIQHKYLVFGEMNPAKTGEDDPRQTALRQLISENKIVRSIVEKADGNTNSLVWKGTDGPAVITFTTRTEPHSWDDQLQSRVSWVESNDSEETTTKVLELKAAAAERPWQSNKRQRSRFCEIWQAYHRGLKPYDVVITFAAKVMPKSKDVSVRRIYQLCLDYTRISALLHQSQRTMTTVAGKEYLTATLEDYRLAFELLSANAPKVLDICSPKAIRVFKARIAPSLADGKVLTGPELRRLLKLPKTTAIRWISDLTAAGLLVLEGKEGKAYKYSKGSETAQQQDLGLITPDQVEAEGNGVDDRTSDSIGPSVQDDPTGSGPIIPRQAEGCKPSTQKSTQVCTNELGTSGNQIKVTL